MSEGPDLLAGLRRRFGVRLREERAAILALAARDDGAARADLVERAHKLAGIAGMLGAGEVGEAALRLEDAILAGEDHAAAVEALDAAIALAIG